MKPIARVLVAVVIGLVLLCTAGYGSKANLTTSEVALIAAPDTSENRVLMRFDLPNLAEGQRVYYADIQFRIENLGPYQELELYELASEWDAGSVDWAAVWNTPGGDVRGERQGCWITDERTGNLVKFVVTRSVARFMSGEDVNHGFVVLTTGENPQKLALPSESPIMTVYTGPEPIRTPHSSIR